MHVLVLAVGLFIISLYLLSVHACWAIGCIVLVLAAGAVRFRKEMLAVTLLMPLLAATALFLYYRPQIPEEVRVVRTYSGSIVVQEGFRKYLIKGNLFDCYEGDLIRGTFEVEFLSPGGSGYVGNLEIREPQITTDFRSSLISFKKKVADELVHRYGYDNGSLMSSLVLGIKDDISERREGDMKSMGIMHILSISGFHFALLENLLKKMRLGRKSIFFMGLYAYFISSIPGYRTLLTITYRSLGYCFRRDPDPVTGVFIAMFIQTFLSPYIIFKIGFLLTYLSTLGILLFHQKILSTMHHLPSSVSLSLSLTLSALSLSFPIIVSLSPEFSLGVFIGNMILVPLYAVFTYLSFLGVFMLPFQGLAFLLLPFVDVFSVFSFHLGNFLSQYMLALNLEMLAQSYVYYVFLVGTAFRKGAMKRGLLLVTLILVLGLPWGTTLGVYNNFGAPFIRITHNFKNYDIMDYRIAENGYIVLRKEEELRLASMNLKIRPSENDREIPHIFVNEKELALPRRMDYSGGVKILHKYVFWNERVMKVK